MSVAPKFEIPPGLNEVCPGARFRGNFVGHTEEEYGLIEWLDVREKPPWVEVEAACLNYLRRRIADNIDTYTSEQITSGFRSSLAPDTPVDSTFEWQFDTQNLYLNSSAVVFPYQLKASSNQDASTNYITLDSAENLGTLYLEFFAHVTGWLDSGRTEKDKLATMTRTQLEEYRDPR